MRGKAYQTPYDYLMNDFFVMYKYRGKGVGKFAVIFDKYKGT